MKRFYRLAMFLLVTGVASSACTATETASPPATTGVGTTLHEVVDRPLVNPQGEVDGLLMQDDAIVRFPPGALASNALASGDSVDVEGDVSTAGPVQLVERATVSRRGTVLASSAPPPPLARRAGPAADAALQPMVAAGTIHALLLNRDGIQDGLLLDDGTTVRVPPRAGQRFAHAAGCGCSSVCSSWWTSFRVSLVFGEAPPRSPMPRVDVSVGKAVEETDLAKNR